MYRLLRQFATEEQGHDLLEFTLMLAFVFLASAALWVSSR